MLRALRDYMRFLRRTKQPVGTNWQSTVLAASEEWVDETNFQFQPTLKNSEAIQSLAQQIVAQARDNPDLDALLRELTSKFALLDGEALSAVDRALGGVVRAAGRNHRSRPNSIDDPVAAAAFDFTMQDETILDDIYPSWRTWRCGPHSSPEHKEAEQSAHGDAEESV
jgi:hypothetical protein